MLAPLENRNVLTVRGCDEECAVEREMRELRRALRASRLRLRRSALRSTRQIMALNAEVSRLQAICTSQAARLERHASGAVVVDLGRKLVALSEANARLVEDSRRAAVLERVLGLAEAERRRLSIERDALACQLVRCRHDAQLGPIATTGGDHVECAL